jgi:hypothetical protein
MEGPYGKLEEDEKWYKILVGNLKEIPLLRLGIDGVGHKVKGS